jgi:hypothetical protein
VLKVRLVLKGFRDLWVSQDLRVQKVHKVPKGLKVLRVLKVM